MSNELDKEKHSKRLHKETSAIRKQLNIARSHGIDVKPYEGHRYAKHHALDCGIPNCVMCSSPRKTFKEKTLQEVSFEQTSKWVEE